MALYFIFGLTSTYIEYGHQICVREMNDNRERDPKMYTG